MPQPTHSELHIDRALTNISVAYQQMPNQYVAHRVFPIVRVRKQSDRYFTYDKADWFRTDAEERPPATESAGSGYNIDNTPTYYSKVYALHKDVDRESLANADPPVAVNREATNFVTNGLMLLRERIWVANYFTTGVWDTDLDGVAAAPGAGEFLQWNDAASTPIEDVTAEVVRVAELTGRRPNKFVMSPYVFNALSNHPDILDRIKYTQRGVVTEELLATLFGVPEVMVTWATQNTAKEGATESMSFLTGKAALLVYAPASPGLYTPSGGYTFAWTGLLGGAAMASRIRRFNMDELNAQRIEGEMAFDMKIIAPDVATFFATAVA